jgi:thymidylate synthase ThyX
MDEFSEEEKQLLQSFVSNLDKPVFVLKNLPEVVKGALFSRYSRTPRSLRKVLLDEFMLAPELGLKEMLQSLPKESELIQKKKAEEFYDRVLVGYGDDSVAELAGAHLAMEDISIIATKVVEDSRIGLSPLEKSTRYVYFDKKRDGKWLYKREKTLMGSEFADLYQETCDLCFQTYADLILLLLKGNQRMMRQASGPTNQA